MNLDRLRSLDNLTLTEIYINSFNFDKETQEAIFNELNRRGIFAPLDTPTTPLEQQITSTQRIMEEQQKLLSMPLYQKVYKTFLRGASLGLLGGKMLPPELAQEDPFFRPFVDENNIINKIFKFVISDYGFSPAGLSEGAGFFFLPGAILKAALSKLGVKVGTGLLSRILSEGGWGISRQVGEKAVELATRPFAPAFERITGIGAVRFVLDKIPAGLRDLTAKTLKEGAILSAPFGIWHTSQEREKRYWEGQKLDSAVLDYIAGYFRTLTNPFTYVIALPIGLLQGYLGTRTALEARSIPTTISKVFTHWWQYGDLAKLDRTIWKSIAKDLSKEISILGKENALTPEIINDAVQRFFYGETKLNTGKPSDILNLKKVFDLDSQTEFLPTFIRNELQNSIGGAVKVLSEITANTQNTRRFFEYGLLKDPDYFRSVLETPLVLKGVEIDKKFYTKFETTLGEQLLGKGWRERLEKLTNSLNNSLEKLAENNIKIAKELLKNDDLRKEMLRVYGYGEQLERLPVDDLTKMLGSNTIKKMSEEIISLLEENPELRERILNLNKSLQTAFQQRNQIVNNLNNIYQKLIVPLSQDLTRSVYSTPEKLKLFERLLNEIGLGIDDIRQQIIESYKRGFFGLTGNVPTIADISKMLRELPPHIRKLLFGDLPIPLAYDVSDLTTKFDKNIDFYKELEGHNRNLALVWQPVFTQANLYWKKIEDLAREKALEMFGRKRLAKPISLPEDIEVLNRAYRKWTEFQEIAPEYIANEEARKLFERYIRTKSGKRFLEEEITRHKLEKTTPIEEKISQDFGKSVKSIVENLPQIQEKLLENENVVKEIVEKTYTIEPPVVIDKNFYKTKIALTSFDELIEPLKNELTKLGDLETAKLFDNLSETGKMGIFASLMDETDEILLSMKAYKEFANLDRETIRKVNIAMLKYIKGLALDETERKIVNDAKNFIFNKYGTEIENIEHSFFNMIIDSNARFKYYLQTGFFNDLERSMKDIKLREAKNLEDIESALKEVIEPEKPPMKEETQQTTKSFVEEIKKENIPEELKPLTEEAKKYKEDFYNQVVKKNVEKSD